MLYRFLQSNPGVRLILPLILGILLGNNFSIQSSYLLLLLGCIVILHFVFIRTSSLKSGGSGKLIFLFILVLGIFIVHHREESYAPPNNLKAHYIKAIILEGAKESKFNHSFPIRVFMLKNGDKIQSTNFKTIVYFPKDSVVRLWNYGDTIIGELNFSLLHDNSNPYAFNYTNFLQRRQIYCTARGKFENIKWNPIVSFSIYRFAREIQEHLSGILEKYIPDVEASGFLQAMTLGNKSKLDTEVQSNFSTSGVIHVLAVSGLHVGILFLLINIVLRPLRGSKRGRIFLVCTGVTIIWAFAFVSGLSVSVIRATTMFSMMQFALLSLRPYRIYNTIAISAFLLLLYNPFYLYEVGFQLSYSAVLSIVTFVPLWEKKIQRKNRWFDKFRQLIFVSLAAQLGVAPLILYYFHQLPTYFLLGNLIVLTLAPFMLGGSLLVILLSALPWLAGFFGQIVSWFTEICLWIVSSIAKLPYATWIDYSLDFYQLFIIYSILLLSIFYSIKKKGFYFCLMLGMVLTFISYTSIRSFQEVNQEILVVHQVNNSSCYSLLKGQSAILYSSKNLTDNTMESVVKPLWDARGIKSSTKIKLSQNVNEKSFNTKYRHILIKRKHIVLCPFQLPNLEKAFDIDIIVFGKYSEWESALRNYNPRLIILDSSFSKRQSQKLMKELSALSYSVYDVNSKGAFVLD